MMLERFKLTDRTAIVTGAGRGIGAATARALADAGANLVIGARTEEQLLEVASYATEQGVRCETVAGDLSTRDGLQQLVDVARDEFGRLDVVVNNVGGSMPTAFRDTSENMFRQSFDWNVTTAFNLSQLSLDLLLESPDASIVNIASTAGIHASRGFTAYGVAKGALIKLSRHMAADLAPKIRVNAVCPGAIATSALEVVTSNAEIEEAMIAGTPMKRLGEPDDIAAAVLYLASPASSYVTGATLEVSGGIQGSNLEMGIGDL